MNRPLKNIVFLGICTMAVLLSFTNARAISLKDNSVIKNDTITLGDIFYDLPGDENRVLGAAPRPGQEMTLNARTLLRIALATGLSWRPANSAEKVTLRREATIIGPEAIELRLIEALSIEGLTGDFSLNIPVEQQKITLPSDQPASFDIARLTLSPDHKTFEAVLSAPSAEKPVQTVHVSGIIQPMIEVPVLIESIQNGRTITESDIEMKKIRDLDFSADTITDTQRLVGMTARRMIAAGRPIRNVDIIAQKIVERGNLVVLTLNSGPLSLATEAKALEDGAMGDVIRVVNTMSNQTLQATVVAANQVSVSN